MFKRIYELLCPPDIRTDDVRRTLSSEALATVIEQWGYRTSCCNGRVRVLDREGEVLEVFPAGSRVKDVRRWMFSTRGI